LVQAHGGELYIDSVLGQGTTVSFTVPAGGGADTL
jgi:signal transduction histidine kinase